MEDNKEKKQVYLLLTYTGTFLSRVIKIYTRKKYSHASISLDKELDRLYSFGRLNAYNPFNGGFVHEGINIGTFKRFKKTKCALYSFEVTQEQYENIENVLDKFINSTERYRFNIIGLFLSGANIKLNRKNYYYCSEFVKYVLDEAKVETGLPVLVKPMDFLKMPDLHLEYEGVLKEYK